LPAPTRSGGRGDEDIEIVEFHGLLGGLPKHGSALRLYGKLLL
jgi:hypothetical protein